MATGADVTYNDALLYLMRDLLPNGLLGLAITGLLAAFMAGMAANISAFNTVFSYDLWQDYVVKDREDGYYLRVGRLATVGATVIAIGTATFAASFSNIMAYLQTLFGFFNAPLFATFILGMFWKRMTATAGWMGLVAGTLSAVVVAFLSEDAFGSLSHGRDPDRRPGRRVPRRVHRVRRRRPAQHRGLAGHQAEADEDLRGLVYSETPKEMRTDPHEASAPWYRRTVPLAGLSLAMVIVLNILF